MNLRELAKEAPHCMGCGLANPDGNQICLAHSNALKHGRGIGHKSRDVYGAYLCMTCHDMVDGRAGDLTKGEKREMHRQAWCLTMEWWIENGYVRVA